jgi:putative endonuclease
MSRDQGCYYVYMLTNERRTVLYIGVTGDLQSRLRQHQAAERPGFTQRYRVNRLVHYETYPDILTAIAREKKLKSWTRAKKNAVVETANAKWNDLSERILGP